MYEIGIQYITVFKRYCLETIFHSEIKGHSSDNNWWILSIIERDLYFMIIYLCMKYESNTPMISKDIARKPFFVRTGRTDKGDTIRGIKTQIQVNFYHFHKSKQIITIKTTAFILKINCLELLEGRK